MGIKKSTLTSQLSSEGAFWIVNKNLAKYINLIDLAVLMEHVFLYDRQCAADQLDPLCDNTQVRYFAYKHELVKMLGVGRDTIRRSEDKLIQLGFIAKKIKITQSKKCNYYALTASTIMEFHKDPLSYIKANPSYIAAIGKERLADIEIIVSNSTPKTEQNQIIPPMDIELGEPVNDLDNDVNCVAQTTQNQPLNNNTINNGVAGATHPADLQSAIVPPGLSTTPTSIASNTTLPSSRRSELFVKPKEDKPSNNKLKRVLLPETIELVKYWNTFETLSKHTLEYSSRTTVRYELQYVYIQKLDDILVKLLKGKYYAKNPEVDHEALKTTAFTVPQIKLAIERFAKIASAEYSKNFAVYQSYKLSDFFYKSNAFMRITLITKDGSVPNKHKYKGRYPFIHCTLFNPVPLAQTGTGHKTTTEYPTTVNNLITLLKDNGGYKDTVMNYNTVVMQTEKAIKNIKAVANGKTVNIIPMLPRYIMNCMSSANRGLHVDNLFFTVEYKLMPYLREIREIA